MNHPWGSWFGQLKAALIKLFKFQSTSQILSNAFLICVGALLMIIGVNYARVEINSMINDQAAESARTYASRVVQNSTNLPELLKSPKGDQQVIRQFGNSRPSGDILGYRIYDLSGHLRIWVDGDQTAETLDDQQYRTQITVPLVSSGKKIGTMITDVNSKGLYDIVMTGTKKIAAILSSAIGFIILVSLLVRANARQETQRNIKRMMQNDPVTGMPNQLAFLEMLTVYHKQEAANHGACHLFMINIDRFTNINERIGNTRGDRLLRMIADRLRMSCGDKVVCARLSGDTFGVLADEQTGIDMDRTLERVFARPFELDDETFRLSASIGVASSTDGLYTTSELQRHAEFALRAAKTNGGQRLVKYDSDTVIEFREVERIASIVEEACDTNGFELHYQPVVDASTRKLKAFEALIRLSPSIGEKIGPDKFIPVAESIGRIDEIGIWALREACTTVSGLPKHITMAVNLSVQQFESRQLVSNIKSIIEETKINPSRLEVEVTEGIMIGDTEAVFDQLAELQKFGVKIALDDFGTGYSSLNYLWRFTFDKLKIDQAFIRASDQHPKAFALLQKIVEVGRTQDMRITAEGIETEEHANRVAKLGCDFSQGYLFGRPIPQTELASVVISDFAEYIREKSNGNADVEDLKTAESA